MNERELERKINEWITKERKNFIRDWCSLVAIKSVSTPGEGGYAFGSGCAGCLDQALSVGAGFGLPTENDDYYCGSVILPGTGEGEIGIVGHLDVVPEGPGWTFDPYTPVCRSGCVLGRGAGDNKGPVTTALYTLKCMKDLGIVLKHSVRVVLGCDEENGMRDMDHFLECHEPPEFSLCCDGTFALHHGEKGILTANLTAELTDPRLAEFYGGAAGNSVASEAAAVLTGWGERQVMQAMKKDLEGIEIRKSEGAVTVKARGIARHAAFPEGSVNAIGRLAGALSKSGLLDEETSEKLAFLGKSFRDYYGEGLHIPFSDELSGPLTCVGGMVSLSRGVLRQNINVRYPITMKDAGEIEAVLRPYCAEHGFAVEDWKDSPPMYMPLENEILQMLIQTCRQVLGREDLKPFVMGGGTHCRKIPNMVGYGPGVPRTGPMKFGDAHGPDEAMEIQPMLDGIKVYVITLMRLDEML